MAEQTKKNTIEGKDVIPMPSDTVEIERSELSAFMDRLNSLEASNKKLLAAADKSRLAAIDAREAADTPLIRTVALSTMGKGGPLIVAWKLTKNISHREGNRNVEDQEMQVFYDDGKNEKMPLITFYRGQNKETRAEIVSRSRDEKSGLESVKLELADGRQLEIPLAFVN